MNGSDWKSDERLKPVPDVRIIYRPLIMARNLFRAMIFGVFMEFQCWEKESDGVSEIVLTTPVNLKQMRQDKKLDDNFIWRYTIHADSTEEAFALHNILKTKV